MGQLDGLSESREPVIPVVTLYRTGQVKQAALTATQPQGTFLGTPLREGEGSEKGERKIYLNLYGGTNLHAFCSAFWTVQLDGRCMQQPLTGWKALRSAGTTDSHQCRTSYGKIFISLGC